jgi:hypothetical protein
MLFGLDEVSRELTSRTDWIATDELFADAFG